jgi:hypothetical protein
MSLTGMLTMRSDRLTRFRDGGESACSAGSGRSSAADGDDAVKDARGHGGNACSSYDDTRLARFSSGPQDWSHCPD